MNDDAKFFFFLSGFFGFVFFYSFSLLLNRDPILSLIYGSSGSIFFSLLGRSLLISALRKVQVSIENTGDSVNEGTQDSGSQSLPSNDKNKSVLDSSLKANQEAVSSKPKDLRSFSTNQ